MGIPLCSVLCLRERDLLELRRRSSLFACFARCLESSLLGIAISFLLDDEQCQIPPIQSRNVFRNYTLRSLSKISLLILKSRRKVITSTMQCTFSPNHATEHVTEHSYSLNSNYQPYIQFLQTKFNILETLQLNIHALMH